MSDKVSQLLLRSLLLLNIALLLLAEARPSQFGENSQELLQILSVGKPIEENLDEAELFLDRSCCFHDPTSEQPVSAEQESNNNVLEPVALSNGWKPWQLEMLAQRLSELNQQGPADYGWERALRNPEISKRQSRYRQCYFNPISCFKK